MIEELRHQVYQSAPASRNSLPRGLLRGSVFIALTILLALHVLDLEAQTSKPTEYEVKAAYLYNFGRFVEWPSRPGAPQTQSFDICLVGQDRFGAALNNTLADETIAGKSVAVKRLQTPQDATTCQILFISASEEYQLKHILTVLNGSSVLTVSDMPEFSRRGGMVQFIVDGSRVRFEINLASAERVGLTLSSELLKLAVNVRKSPALGD
jgi:hypothetical protein